MKENNMKPKEEHIFLLIQAGYSAKNFILSGFLNQEKAKVTLWSDQNYLKKYNINNELVLLPKHTYNRKVNFFKKLKNKSELSYFSKRFKNKNYFSYLSKIENKKTSLKVKIIDRITSLLSIFYSSEKGIQNLDSPFFKVIRKTNYYKACKKQLEAKKPTIVFCTHQRATAAIAPILAAQDLGIRTICFIHSWDNIPKGLQLVKADEYFVWSDYMKKEMLEHYSFINALKIKVTGTPQFTMHLDNAYRLDRKTFFEMFNLPIQKKYILFSGNDRTTSPNDPIYLNDLAKSVEELNLATNNYHILFRPNPIDKNEGFRTVLEQYKNIITEIKPEWFGSDKMLWNQGGPNKKDVTLMINTIFHSDLLVTMGSTMAIDAAILNKPSCYINYDVESNFNWSVKMAYNFIHFNIIKDIKPLFWIDERNKFKETIKEALINPNKTKNDREVWINRVTKTPIEETKHRMWNYLIDKHEV
mgnify:CR=1 FL=1